MATQAQITAVQQLYVGYLGRAADSAGLAFWADAIANGTATIASVATGFTLSNEYKAAYAGLDSAALVDQVYTNVLGRAPDAEGKAYWVDALAKGTVTADTLVSFIVTNLGALDQATINNKVFVAQTYTDTAGANYNVAAGTASIVGVDSTAASVTTALGAISNGTLTGLVPAQGLINALATAQAAIPTFETTNKAAIDALVAKLAPIDTGAAANKTDVLTAASTFSEKLTAAKTDADAARVTAGTVAGGAAEASTDVLVTRAATAATELATARAALTTTADKNNADKYVAALATEATAKAAAATAIDKAAVVAGLGAEGTATAAIKTVLDKYTDAGALYSTYVNATGAERGAIDTAFKDSKYFATFKATVAKDAAYADAIKATAAVKDLLDTDKAANADVTLNGVTVKLGVDATVGSAEADAFVGKAVAKAAADKALADAKVADVNKAAVDALAKQYQDVKDVVTKAGTAIADFNNASTTAKAVAITAVTADVAVKESFYFAAKPTGIAADDHAIATFGAGDSIVLGSGYTYNSGALSTGNNNAAEFFLVKTDAGVQVVVENTVYGSAGVTPVAATGVAGAAGVADNLTAITLTGVTLDHLSVANGVVSYV